MDCYYKYRDAFLRACKNGDFKIMKTISEKCHGYVRFYCPKTGENGIHKCARNLDSVSSLTIAEYILSRWKYAAFAKHKTNSTYHYTPLILATHLQSEHLVRKLSKNIYPLNSTTSKEICMSEIEIYPPGSTALHIAILSENIQIITLLLSAGALFCKADQNGETVLELAQKAKNARRIMPLFGLPINNYAFTLVDTGQFTAKKR